MVTWINLCRFAYRRLCNILGDSAWGRSERTFTITSDYRDDYARTTLVLQLQPCRVQTRVVRNRPERHTLLF